GMMQVGIMTQTRPYHPPKSSVSSGNRNASGRLTLDRWSYHCPHPVRRAHEQSHTLSEVQIAGWRGSCPDQRVGTPCTNERRNPRVRVCAVRQLVGDRARETNTR